MAATPEGRMVRARDAEPGQAYRCPGCAAPVFLRKGQIRLPHFAHRGTSACSPETSLHRGVKAWIAAILRDHLVRARAFNPRIRVPCHGSRWLGEVEGGRRCPGAAWIRVSDLVFDEVLEEASNGDGLRPDVLLLHQGRPVLGIEVLVSHPVDSAKAARTTHPWLELDALRVVASAGSWKPAQGVFQWTGSCRHCALADRMDRPWFSEITDPGDFAAEWTAALMVSELDSRLQTRSRRSRMRIAWKCRWCRASNFRAVPLSALQAVTRASFLGPPIVPEARLQLAGGSTLAIRFAFHRRADLGRTVLPLPPSPLAAIQVAPTPVPPLRLTLIGTNRPWAFICARCGRDCLGTLPSPCEPWTEWPSSATS